MNLEKSYEIETGRSPSTIYHHCGGPTIGYVKWLEEKIAALETKVSQPETEERTGPVVAPATEQSTPLFTPEPHLGTREPMHGDAFVEFVDE